MVFLINNRYLKVYGSAQLRPDTCKNKAINPVLTPTVGNVGDPTKSINKR